MSCVDVESRVAPGLQPFRVLSCSRQGAAPQTGGLRGTCERFGPTQSRACVRAPPWCGHAGTGARRRDFVSRCVWVQYGHASHLPASSWTPCARVLVRVVCCPHGCRALVGAFREHERIQPTPHLEPSGCDDARGFPWPRPRRQRACHGGARARDRQTSATTSDTPVAADDCPQSLTVKQPLP